MINKILISAITASILMLSGCGDKDEDTGDTGAGDETVADTATAE
jgi:hypothetical protein